ncbi:MAG TPA: hypothetical protein VJT75_14755 [Thermoleophilaceae bacterium]|nr:hypothetical protein [Thermoleophilaceae bacterium]
MVGILLFVLGANQDNWFVSAVMDAGRWLVHPFDNLFSIDNAKAERAVNWGIVAAAYFLVGALIAGLLARAAVGGGRTHSWRWRRGAHV